MPILVRPVREQIEHDRVIRQLQDKWRRKYRADINPGDERTAVVQAGPVQFYPDLVLTTEGQKKPNAVVEVETSESVNHLEAMSQWATFAKSRIPFYLFVPAGSLDAARRLVADHQIELTELWTYFFIGEQVRFTPVIRSASSASDVVADAPVGKRSDRRVEKTERGAEKPVTVATVERTDEPAAEKAPIADRQVTAKAVDGKAAEPKGAGAKTADAKKADAKTADAKTAEAKPAAQKADRAEKAVDKGVERVAEKGDVREKVAKEAPKAERKREEPRPAERAARPQRSERAAAPPASKPRRAGASGRASAPPPRRKAAAGKRVAAPKRGSARPAAKRAAAPKRPVRRSAKPAAAAVRRPAKTSRPAAKRARAQKRK